MICSLETNISDMSNNIVKTFLCFLQNLISWWFKFWRIFIKSHRDAVKSNADSKGVRLEAPLLVDVEVNKTLLRGCENPPESPTNQS